MTSPSLNPSLDSTPLEPPARQPVSQTRSNKEELVFVCLLAIVLLPVIGYFLWFDARVPVSAQDLKDSSWNHTWTIANYLGQVLGAAMALGSLLMGCLLGVAKRSALPVLAGAMLAAAMHTATTETAQFRFQAAAGFAKIGCFVWDSKDCRTMLGVAPGNAPSMYVSPQEQARTGKVFTDWYENRAETVDFSEGFFASLRELASPDALNAKLAAQRDAVTRFRKSGGSSH